MNDVKLIDPDWGLLREAAAKAAALTADGGGDVLVVLPYGTDFGNATQHDDGVTAIAAIDLLRELVADYEAFPDK